jgi:hypothetical protein
MRLDQQSEVASSFGRKRLFLAVLLTEDDSDSTTPCPRTCPEGHEGVVEYRPTKIEAVAASLGLLQPSTLDPRRVRIPAYSTSGGGLPRFGLSRCLLLLLGFFGTSADDVLVVAFVMQDDDGRGGSESKRCRQSCRAC